MQRDDPDEKEHFILFLFSKHILSFYLTTILLGCVLQSECSDTTCGDPARGYTREVLQDLPGRTPGSPRRSKDLSGSPPKPPRRSNRTTRRSRALARGGLELQDLLKSHDQTRGRSRDQPEEVLGLGKTLKLL